MSKLLIPQCLKEKNDKVYWGKESLGFKPIDKVRKLFELNGLQGEVLVVSNVKFGMYTKTTVKYCCLICNTNNEQRIRDLIDGNFCKKCGRAAIANANRGKTRLNNSPKTLEDAQTIIGSGFETKGFGKIGSTKTIIAKCLICKNITEKQVGHWRRGYSCKICSDRSRLLSLEAFITKAKEVHTNVYTYENVDYKGTGLKVAITCKRHGTFRQTPLNHLNGSGCPKCRSSKGEIKIRKFFFDKGIEVIEQQTFEGCVYKRKLKFDFYVPSLNLCIEWNGEQHYEHVNLYHRRGNSLQKQQHKDKIKRDFCRLNNIQLLELDSRVDYSLEEVFKPYLERLQTNAIHPFTLSYSF